MKNNEAYQEELINREDSTGYSFEKDKLKKIGYKKHENGSWTSYIKQFSYNTQKISFFENGFPRDRVISIEQGRVASDEQEELKAIYQICKDKGWI